MKFSREQFGEIIEGNRLPLDDIPIELTVDQEYELFNTLPHNLQGKAIQWGINDTEWREDFMEFILKSLFDYTIEEWYESKLGKAYFISRKKMRFDSKQFTQFINNVERETRLTPA